MLATFLNCISFDDLDSNIVFNNAIVTKWMVLIYMRWPPTDIPLKLCK